ncbi:MAG: AAA family ATPase [Salegentibacter sp.]
MKILKIEFKNINSLRGNHVIDFSEAPFTTNSLFAITGPTGSGKSTILDVISLALFNMVPRVGKITKNEILATGAILTRNQQDAYARVTYECRSGQFASQWSISTNRNGNLRDYDMQLENLLSRKLIDLKKSEVPAKNEELIGLNYNQFIKSVLLAQGEFAQFLKVKKDERGELLEKITGTGIYRQLGRKAFEKNREVSQEIQNQQTQIKIIEEELLEEELHGEFTRNLKEKMAACEPLEKAIDALSKSIELKKNIRLQEEEIDKNTKNKAVAEAGLKTFEEEQGVTLKQHEKIQDFAEELRTRMRLKETAAEIGEEQKNNQEQEKTINNSLENQLEKISVFTGTRVEEATVQEELEKFTRKVAELQESRANKISEYRNLQQLFKRETRELETDFGEDHEKNIQQLNQLKSKSVEKISAFRKELETLDLSDLPKEKLRLKKDLDTAREAWRQSEKIANTGKDLKKKQSEELQILAKTDVLPKQIEEKKSEAGLAEKNCENLQLKRENQLMRAQLEDYRRELKENEPCPLCGAVHHPYAKELPGQDDKLDEQLKEAEKRYKLLNNELTALNATLKHHQERLAQVKAEKEKLETEHQSLKMKFTEEFKSLSSEANIDWEAKCNHFQAQAEKLERFEKENIKLKAIAEGMPLLEKTIAVVREGKEIKEKIDALYAGNDVHKDSRELQSGWVELQQQQKNILARRKELNEKVEANLKNLEKLQVQLQQKVAEKDFASIEEAQKALMPEAEYNRLRKKREDLKTETSKFETSLKVLSAQLERLKKQDSEKTLDELNEELQEQKDLLASNNKECEELRRKLNNHQDNLNKVNQIREKIAEKEKQIKRWRLLNELIGDSQGKKFNEFAQDLTLSQLLLLANKRLVSLSDRYRIDKPTSEEDDGLVAIDEHMGGQRRSVKTLSGGETFILSLSMALALSDLASRNVEINSLFIDEGFGTLDPETLDQTLDTLEKLQAESSKTIGIISHVDSLKERIATQIQLERNGQGYSQLVVKG